MEEIVTNQSNEKKTKPRLVIHTDTNAHARTHLYVQRGKDR